MERESVFEDEPSRFDEVDALADRIASSAATVDATMHQLLAQIRRFDELKGWARQGAKTCAHWLSWRVGDGLVAAREKVRVARALGSLSLIDAAFAKGEVSYAKVRAITRVARSQTESLLLHYALHSTGAQLERICRGYRGVERICESGREALPQERSRRPSARCSATAHGSRVRRCFASRAIRGSSWRRWRRTEAFSTSDGSEDFDGTLMFFEPRGDAIEDAPPALPPEQRAGLSAVTNRPRMLQRLDLGAAVQGLVVRAGLH